MLLFESTVLPRVKSYITTMLLCYTVQIENFLRCEAKILIGSRIVATNIIKVFVIV